MTPLIITAGTAISAMGNGLEETRKTLLKNRNTLQSDNFQLQSQGYIGRVSGIESHSLPAGLSEFDCRNNRLADMALINDDFIMAVAEARAYYGAHRIAVIMGTSTSGILSSEEAFSARPLGEKALPEAFNFAGTQDLSSLPYYASARLGITGPLLAVSNACASSTRSFIDAAHLIKSGFCDAAIVGGADSLCRMTLQGFASLGLVSPKPIQPCDEMRDGISIGEAAGFALIERAECRPLAPHIAGYRVRLAGYGASSDGYHMSSPDPTGKGALLAMRSALIRANLSPSDIGYINMHGTGTRANDEMEDKAISALFGKETPCSSTKGWSGHTLGASGILESLICAISLEENYLPPCKNSQKIDSSFQSNILLSPLYRKLDYVMNNAFGFGGTNCSLIFGKLS